MKKLYVGLLMLMTLTAGYSQMRDPVDKHAGKGVELFEAGRYRAAQTELTKARRLAAELPQDETTAGLLMTIDYMLAGSAARLGESDAMIKLRAFIADYPSSSYAGDARFAIANLLYAQEDYAGALAEYASIDRFGLNTSQVDEYSFKRGHAYFMQGDYQNAGVWFNRVAAGGEYSVHAKYYAAYTDYTEGRYAAAKRGFREIAYTEAYGPVVPFYLLQIEFLEGNYDYVVSEGDALLEVAVGEREQDIARIMGESWFHKGDYGRALQYMYLYRDRGGNMGREENYLVGYSEYARNDIEPAIISLSKVVGPDDQLTQNAAYHLGGAFLRRGDKQRAMQAFSMASGAYFDDGIREDALFNYGKLQYELGGGVFNEAINILTRYLREYPDSPRTDEAREYLIAAYYNSRNYEAAYDAIKQMPNPDNNLKTAFQKIAYFRAMEYYNDGDYDTAYRLLGEALDNSFNQKYTALTQFWRAEILFRRGQYNEAIPLYRNYITVSPNTEREHQMAHYNLGYSYFNLQRWADALGWFERFAAMYRTPDSYRADALNRAGDVQSSIRAFQEAIESYDAAIAVGTKEKYYAQYQKAVTTGILDRSNTRKVEMLKAIINSKEGDYVDDAMYELGRTYIGMERFTDAATTLRQYVNDYPNGDKYLAALSDLGLAYQNLYDNNSALRYYQMVVEKAPASPQAQDAMIAIRSLYMDMNNVDAYFDFAAKSGVETDASVISRDSLTFVSAERVYLTAGNRNNAIASLQDYLDKFPTGSYRANALYYLADSYITDGRRDAAITSLQELSDMHHNSFTVRGLERLGSLCFERERYTEAATAYRKLTQAAVNPETVANAWTGYFNSVKAGGDQARIAAAADEVLAAAGANATVKRQATAAKAAALDAQGRSADALALYRELATETNTAEGAEATYHVIQAMFDSGDPDGAERRIFAFAESNSPQTYWLGRSFLVLGDIYIQRGDNFQARATLQSILDGYSPSDDGVVAGARQRIEKLGNTE